jgi:hypothetical protein
MIATDPKKKTMHFPGIGKVTRRDGKVSWKILDENLLIDFLTSQGVKNQVVETQETIIKKEVNKLFDCWDDQKVKVPGVEKKDAKESISITFDDNDAPPPATQKAMPQKTEPAISEMDL